MNKIYRWLYVGNNKTIASFMPKWVERQEATGTTTHYTYRDEQSQSWRFFTLPHPTFSESMKYWNSEPDWELVATIEEAEPQLVYTAPNNLNFRHKCRCSKDTIWREGCKCGGI